MTRRLRTSSPATSRPETTASAIRRWEGCCSPPNLSDGGCGTYGREKCEQLTIHDLAVRPREAVRRAFDHHELASLDHLGGAFSAESDRNRSIGIAVDDEGRHVDAFQIGAEIGAPRIDARERTRW